MHQYLPLQDLMVGRDRLGTCKLLTLANLDAWINHNQSSKLTRLPKKAVVIALIRWVFRKRSEWKNNNEDVDLQMLQPIVIALHNSGTPNKMAIFLAYVQNDILQEVDKSNNKALDMLDKAATAKQKKHDKEFEDRMEFIQLARLRQIETSMKQYVVLNDKAYQLGFETFNLESAVELVERVVADGVIGVGKKFVVTLLVMRTFLA